MTPPYVTLQEESKVLSPLEYKLHKSSVGLAPYLEGSQAQTTYQTRICWMNESCGITSEEVGRIAWGSAILADVKDKKLNFLSSNSTEWIYTNQTLRRLIYTPGYTYYFCSRRYTWLNISLGSAQKYSKGNYLRYY